MDLKARDISMLRCSLLDSCSAKRHNNILHKQNLTIHKMDFLLKMTVFMLPKMDFKLSGK